MRELDASDERLSCSSLNTERYSCADKGIHVLMLRDLMSASGDEPLAQLSRVMKCRAARIAARVDKKAGVPFSLLSSYRCVHCEEGRQPP